MKRRVRFAVSYTWQSYCRVFSGLCRVFVALGKVAESGSEAEEGALTILTQANDKARSYTREAMQVHPWFFLEQWSEVFSPWIIYSL